MNALDLINSSISELTNSNTSYERKHYLIEMFLDETVNGIQNNFLMLGYVADSIQNKKFGYVDFSFNRCYCMDVIDFLKAKYSIEKSTVYSAIECYRQYCVPDKENIFTLSEKYKNFSQSKLVEMLPLPKEEREKIKPEMTVKEIRQFKKKLLPKEEKPEQKHEDPTQLSINSADIESDEESESGPKIPDVWKEPIIIEASKRTVQNKTKVLSNEKERKEWLNNYEAWGVWIEVPELMVKYYRYDFCNGDYCVVSSWKNPEAYIKDYHYGSHNVLYHLVRPNDFPKSFHPGGNAQSIITKYLQDKKMPVHIFEVTADE